MRRLFALPLLLAVPAGPVQKDFDAQARAAAVTPFVDDLAVSVLHIELARVDPSALAAKLAALGKLDPKDVEGPVALDGPLPAAEIPHEQQIKTLEEIIIHLEDGGTLGKRTLLFKGEWKNLIAQSGIDGNRPTELIHFEALLAATHLRRLRTNLVNRWDRQLASLGVPSARDFGSEPEDTCAQYIEQIRSLLS